jgi:hypothetical protein
LIDPGLVLGCAGSPSGRGLTVGSRTIEHGWRSRLEPGWGLSLSGLICLRKPLARSWSGGAPSFGEGTSRASRPNSFSGSLAMLASTRRASSYVSKSAARKSLRAETLAPAPPRRTDLRRRRVSELSKCRPRKQNARLGQQLYYWGRNHPR